MTMERTDREVHEVWECEGTTYQAGDEIRVKLPGKRSVVDGKFRRHVVKDDGVEWIEVWTKQRGLRNLSVEAVR